MEIARDIYLNKLISKKNNGLIKVVTGMHRCGKSYLLFNLFRDHLRSEGVPDDHVIEMAFDSFENKKYRDPEAFYQYLVDRLKDDSMYYVLLDEVQLLDDFEDILNSLARRRNTDVYVTGSNAKFLSKDIITEFRGRGDEVRMYPLTFKTVKNRTISPTTIRRYIDYLCDAFLIDKAIRYDIKGKKHIDTPAKYYFTDLGLRNARLNFRQVEETHAMENVIFNELKVRGYNVDVGIVPVSGKDRTGKSVRKQLEIDFVCNRGSKRYYIQSAFAMPDEEYESYLPQDLSISSS